MRIITKKFSIAVALLSVLFLFGCEDKLNSLTVDELLQEANILYENKDYEESIRFFENFELRFPVHEKVPESIYKRAMSYYLSGKYAQAVAVFEVFLDRYPMHDNKIEAQKRLFYCFYNQVSRYDRDYSLLEKALEYGEVYKNMVYNDKEFYEAYSNLTKFFGHYYLHIIHSSLDRSPKYWIQVLWNAHSMIMQHPKNPETAEAYYRVIEFLCAQNNKSTREDAKIMLEQMKVYHSNSQWYALACKCIVNAQEVYDQPAESFAL